MYNKDIFIRMGGWSQLFFFLFLVLVGLFATSILLAIIMIFFSPHDLAGIDTQNILQNVTFTRVAQILQAIFLFLFPSFCFAWLFNQKPAKFLQTNNSPNFRSILFVIILFIVIQPSIQLVSHYNQQIDIPEWFGSFGDWLKQTELSNEKLLEQFFSDKSTMGFIANFFIIAIVAGVAEEFFFRGSMQQIMNKIVYNKHAAVWITAIIFSVIHFQFSGFIPRVLLGAVLGYLFLWSGNIWMPIAGHITNNAIYVILAQIYYGTPEYDGLEKFDVEKYGMFGLLSALITLGLLFIYQNKPLRTKYLQA